MQSQERAEGEFLEEREKRGCAPIVCVTAWNEVVSHLSINPEIERKERTGGRVRGVENRSVTSSAVAASHEIKSEQGLGSWARRAALERHRAHVTRTIHSSPNQTQSYPV